MSFKVTIYKPDTFGITSIGYVDGMSIYDDKDNKVGELVSTSLLSNKSGFIKLESDGSKIGTFDSNFWYDSKGRAVLEHKFKVLSESYTFMKTPYYREFIEKLFRT